MAKHMKSPLAFVLGCLLTFAAVQLPSRLRLGVARDGDLTLVIPALAAETYTYRETRGFTAVLSTESGRQLEVPGVWLPGKPGPGTAFQVRTRVRPADTVMTFETTIVPVE